MDIRKLTAIDAHSHLNHGAPHDTRTHELYEAHLDALLESAAATGIGATFVSTFDSVLSTDGVEAENDYLHELVQQIPSLYQWVVIDPRNPRTLEQAQRMLRHAKCVGVKIHPYYHRYTLAEYGDAIFSLVANEGAVLLTHPEKEIGSVLPFADAYPDARVILAHLGSVEHVDAMARARHGNILTDTSGSASSMNRVVEYAVSRLGSERILFGTDTYAAGFQRGRIEYALLSDTDKRNILCDNARRVFGVTVC